MTDEASYQFRMRVTGAIMMHEMVRLLEVNGVPPRDDVMRLRAASVGRLANAAVASTREARSTSGFWRNNSTTLERIVLVIDDGKASVDDLVVPLDGLLRKIAVTAVERDAAFKQSAHV